MNIQSGLPRFSLTPDEAAESTGFSRTRIFQAIRHDELMARKDGKAVVIETDKLLRWLRSLPTRGRQVARTDHSTRVRCNDPNSTPDLPPKELAV